MANWLLAGQDDNDGATLLSVQTGDHRAIASLYDRYAVAVYSTALRILRDPAHAEQVLSDVFLEVWSDPDPFTRLLASETGLTRALIVRAHRLSVARLHNSPAHTFGPLASFPVSSADSTRKGRDDNPAAAGHMLAGRVSGDAVQAPAPELFAAALVTGPAATLARPSLQA